MKLKDVKKFINKLSKEELEKELMYNSPDNSISGVVSKIHKQRGNLYWDGEDDPCILHTRKQLKEEYENEIEQFTLEIPKGSVVIEF